MLRALRARPDQEGPRLLEGQPPEGRPGRRVRRRRRPAGPRRADLRPGPADGGGLRRVRRRAQCGRHHRAAVQPHPQRGRAAGRPGDDHPRGPGRGVRAASTRCATCTAPGCGPRSSGAVPDLAGDRPASTTSPSTGPVVSCTVEPEALPAVLAALTERRRPRAHQHAAHAGGAVPRRLPAARRAPVGDDRSPAR